MLYRIKASGQDLAGRSRDLGLLPSLPLHMGVVGVVLARAAAVVVSDAGIDLLTGFVVCNA